MIFFTYIFTISLTNLIDFVNRNLFKTITNTIFKVSRESQWEFTSIT